MVTLDRPIHWVAGDADLDFDVDFGDFLLLSQGFGQEGDWASGDFDMNGTVGFADFLLLSNNFGRTSTSAANVQESTSSPLLLGSLFLLSTRRRRNHR